MPSITVLSEGPAVMFGAIPMWRQTHVGIKKAFIAVKREAMKVIEVREQPPVEKTPLQMCFIVSASLLHLCVPSMLCATNSSQDSP